MKIYWIVLVLFLTVYSGTFTQGEDVVYIPESEVEGIPIGAFYLSTKPITNQDYFNFIQADGYRNKLLWYPQALEKFEQFKNAQGEYSPRTWPGFGPPVGQEFEIVMGISSWEALAYAKSVGRTLPSEKMWKLAQKVNSDLGPYPWAEEKAENQTAIFLASYHAPAKSLENRLSTLQEAADLAKKSASSIGRININYSNIARLERSFKALEKDFQNKVKALEFKMAQDKSAEVDRLIQETNNLSAKILLLETEQKTLSMSLEQVKSESSRWEKLQSEHSRYDQELKKANQVKEQIQTDLLTIREEQSSLKTIQKEQQEKTESILNAKVSSLQSQHELIQKKLSQSVVSLEANIKGLEKSSQEQNKSLKQLQNSSDALVGKVNSQVESKLVELSKQNSQFEQKQSAAFQEKIEQWQSQINRISDIDKQLQVWVSNFKQLSALCPPLSNGKSYAQSLSFLETELGKLVSPLTQNQADIAFLKSASIAQNQKLKNLQQRDSHLESSLDDSFKSTNKRSDEQGKELTRLTSLVTQIESKNRELEDKLANSRKIDIDHTKKSENLEIEIRSLKSNVQEQNSVDKNLETKIESLSKISRSNESKIEVVEASLGILKTKDSQLEREFKEQEQSHQKNMDSLRNEADAIRKQIYQENQRQLAKLTAKTENNYTQIIGINRELKQERRSVGNRLKRVESGLNKIIKDTIALDTDFRIAATQMRQNMVDIGQKMLQIFQNKDLLVGPVSPEKEIQKKPEEKPKEEEKKEVKPQNIEMEITKVLVNSLSLGKLCSSLGEIYFDHKETQKALDLMNLALAYCKEEIEQQATEKATLSSENKKAHQAVENQVKKTQKQIHEIRSFLKSNWAQLNCPQKMSYIAPGEFQVGHPNDVAFPLRKLNLPGFYMDQHEVTQADFALFVKEGYGQEKYWSEEGNGWREKRQKPLGWKKPDTYEKDLPATNLTFFEAQAYATWAGKRLPTPQEWERVARYTDLRQFPWGNESPRKGNYFRANFRQLGKTQDAFVNQPAPVGHFPDDCSPEGVFDLAGNVAEWCQGWHKDPKKKFRSVKGGSFENVWFELQGYVEHGQKANWSNSYIGFRCVQEIPPLDSSN